MTYPKKREKKFWELFNELKKIVKKSCVPSSNTDVGRNNSTTDTGFKNRQPNSFTE